MKFFKRFRSKLIGLDVGAVATRHLFRGHDGEALLCKECVDDTRKLAEGWVAMGTHAGPMYCSYPGLLEFSEPNLEDGMSKWERHEGCSAAVGGR